MIGIAAVNGLSVPGIEFSAAIAEPSASDFSLNLLKINGDNHLGGIALVGHILRFDDWEADMAGWALRSQRRTLVGRLERVTVSSGIGQDRDTNFKIVPNKEDEELLINRHGKPNASGSMFCEVQVWSPFRAKFGQWINGLVGGTVIACGVWVDDTGHHDTTELHPLDLISGPVTRSINSSGDWIARLANDTNLQVGRSLLAYRFAAASDTRKSLFFAGPPLSRKTRPTQVTLDFPPRPASDMIASIAWRIELAHKTEVDVQTVGTGSDTKLRVGARCKAEGDGGPGVVLGEAAAYWRRQQNVE